jgi:hypothetical protein
MVFIYCIVPEGTGERDALVRANLYAATVEIAKEHVRTVTAPGLSGSMAYRSYYATTRTI